MGLGGDDVEQNQPCAVEQIAGAVAALEGRTEMDAMIAYLQSLGTALGSR